jgi:hypothetical protein
MMANAKIVSKIITSTMVIAAAVARAILAVEVASDDAITTATI